ncbi:MAG: tRNA (adenosine(37)-N6)-threonylcarbamoyltransferase complex ATPase subunit type 1 TsaE [Gammaproteobacteria bacterium]|jgi:tRNA threonylcarbamoyladenosine biosynthesis protein TsaE|tara:strand:+ start:307 stop:789 length:483 start_codon:yes stop_codon:yes gene_type:complete
MRNDLRKPTVKIIASEAEMEILGAQIASAAGSSCVFYLDGPLGAGKTVLARGYIRELGFIGPVKSPTFTLVEPYDVGGVVLNHFDLYRLNDPRELEFIGIEDYFSSGANVIVEWAEKGVGFLPTPDLYISLNYSSQCDSREVGLVSATKFGDEILLKMGG